MAFQLPHSRPGFLRQLLLLSAGRFHLRQQRSFLGIKLQQFINMNHRALGLAPVEKSRGRFATL